MALKDWEKLEPAIEGNYLFANKWQLSRRIALFRDYPKRTFEFFEYESRKLVKTKKFSSKEKALKFATDYMRLH